MPHDKKLLIESAQTIEEYARLIRESSIIPGRECWPVEDYDGRSIYADLCDQARRLRALAGRMP